VAGIKGTIYECYAEGVIKVREGSMVAAYPGANGAIVTQVIMSMQMFDIRTGILSPLPDIDKTGMDGIIRELQAGLLLVPQGLKPPAVNPVEFIIYIPPVVVQQYPPPPVSGY
jgi:hypothetical protein